MSGARITDLNILAEAVKAVTKGKARLVRNQKQFRTYPGQDSRCDHCIHIDGVNYDIGIRKQADGSWGLIADFSLLVHNSPFLAKGHTLQQLHQLAMSSRGSYDQECARFATGALMQEYILQTAEEQAAILGRTTQRVTGKNGAVALEIVERG